MYETMRNANLRVRVEVVGTRAVGMEPHPSSPSRPCSYLSSTDGGGGRRGFTRFREGFTETLGYKGRGRRWPNGGTAGRRIRGWWATRHGQRLNIRLGAVRAAEVGKRDGVARQ